jgi:hypothetical protein
VLRGVPDPANEDPIRAQVTRDEHLRGAHPYERPVAGGAASRQPGRGHREGGHRR